MRKADIAEWILSLTTTPERAASMAGDLAEQATAQGLLWFWGSLLRTTAAFVGRAWADNPGRMTALAFGACLCEAGLLILMLIAILAMAIVLFLVMTVSSGTMPRISHVWGFRVGWTLALTGSVICEFFVGKWLARRAPGQEIAACIAFLCVERVFWLVVISLVNSGYWSQTSSPAELALSLLITGIGVIALFAGAAHTRRRTLDSHSSLGQRP